ncbi:hypothetical protein BTVI_130615 [Pitangus sulphuratus]|nr:hypothetical protein BTVI_130615 [Pitangus sulphuratus]
MLLALEICDPERIYTGAENGSGGLSMAKVSLAALECPNFWQPFNVNPNPDIHVCSEKLDKLDEDLYFPKGLVGEEGQSGLEKRNFYEQPQTKPNTAPSRFL